MAPPSPPAPVTPPVHDAAHATSPFGANDTIHRDHDGLEMNSALAPPPPPLPHPFEPLTASPAPWDPP
jgi:hypothetical protein